MRGRVKWFEPELARGIVTGDDGKEYEVHLREVQTWPYRCLEAGQVVTFTPGDEASEVKIA